MKAGFKSFIRDYLYMIVAAFLSAYSYYVFVLPNCVVPGGVSGVASILQYAVGFPAKYGLLLLNVPILILATVMLNKGFTVKTIFVTLLTSGFMEIFELLSVPVFDADVLVAVLFGGVIAGLSMIFTGAGNGSSGGTEVIGRIIIKKNPDVQVGQTMMYFNLVIMTVGGFFVTQGVVYDLWLVVYSLVYSFVTSFVLDKTTKGFDPAIKFTIITDKPTQVSEAIFQRRKTGISAAKLISTQNVSERYTMLVVVVPFRYGYLVKQALHESDDECFAFTTDVEDVISRPDFSKLIGEHSEKR